MWGLSWNIFFMFLFFFLSTKIVYGTYGFCMAILYFMSLSKVDFDFLPAF